MNRDEEVRCKYLLVEVPHFRADGCRLALSSSLSEKSAVIRGLSLARSDVLLDCLFKSKWSCYDHDDSWSLRLGY